MQGVKEMGQGHIKVQPGNAGAVKPEGVEVTVNKG
jgi:hypothetical protein